MRPSLRLNSYEAASVKYAQRFTDGRTANVEGLRENSLLEPFAWSKSTLNDLHADVVGNLQRQSRRELIRREAGIQDGRLDPGVGRDFTSCPGGGQIKSAGKPLWINT